MNLYKILKGNKYPDSHIEKHVKLSITRCILSFIWTVDNDSCKKKESIGYLFNKSIQSNETDEN